MLKLINNKELLKINNKQINFKLDYQIKRSLLKILTKVLISKN